MNKNHLIVALIILIFFVISFLTNILGPIIPDLIASFDLSLALAGFLPFAFFVAYGVMSIPAGLLVDRYKEKKVLLLAFSFAFVGALLFALLPSFSIAMLSLFLIGVGMAMLQVVINPLLRTSGGEAHFAFNSVLGQLAFGGASFLSPMLYSYLVRNLGEADSPSLVQLLAQAVPEGMKWLSLYWVFAAIALLMLAVISLVRFPSVELRADEKVDLSAAFGSLSRQRTVWLFFIGIFCYVGTEQGIANWISKFLQTYHQLDPAVEGAQAISYFWGLLTLGCLLGLILLKVFDSRKVLMLFTAAAMISLALGLFGSAHLAIICFPLTGFFASVMWSIIFSLALNSVPQHHGTFSGILCTAIAGGAIFPLVVGVLGDWIGLRLAMLFLMLPLAYIFSIGIWARPLINNATISTFKELLKPGN